MKDFRGVIILTNTCQLCFSALGYKLVKFGKTTVQNQYLTSCKTLIGGYWKNSQWHCRRTQLV